MKTNRVMDLKEAIRAAARHGWNLKGVECYLTPYGTIEFIFHETWWEIDPETGASRYRGFGAGCFWSEWEGGHEDD